MENLKNSYRSIVNKQFSNIECTIIGCGSVGSKVAIELHQLGIRDFYIIDKDKVEAKNINNQIFTTDYLDWYKVDALEEILQRRNNLCNILIEKDYKYIDGVDNILKRARGIIFVCVDSMSARKSIISHIFDLSKISKIKPIIIEARTGKDETSVYMIEDNKDFVNWKKEWYPDSEVVNEPDTCANPMNSMVSSLAAIRMVSIAKRYIEDKPIEKIIIDGLNPTKTICIRKETK